MKIKMVVIAGVVFSLFFSLLMFMMILFADSEDSASTESNLGGLNVSAEVLKHKPMAEKIVRNMVLKNT